MAVSYNNDTGYYDSDVTGQSYPDAASAHAAEAAAGGAPPPTSGNQQAVNTANANQPVKAMADPNSPTYKGPGYNLTYGANGAAQLTRDPAKDAAQGIWEQQQLNTPSAASNPNSAMNIPGASSRPAATTPYTGRAQITGSTTIQTPWAGITRGTPAPATTAVQAPAANPFTAGAAGGSQYTPTGAVDYSRYDQAATSYDRAINTFQAELDRLSGVDPFGNQALLQQATDRAAGQAQGLAAGGLSTATARAGNMRQALNTAANVSAQGRQAMVAQRAQDTVAAEQQRLTAAGGIANVAGQRAANEVQLAQTQTDALQKNLDRALQGTEFAQKLSQQDVENLRQAAVAYSQIDQQRYATDIAYRQSVDQDITQRYMSDNTLQAAMQQIQANSNMTPKDWLMGGIGLATGVASAGIAKSDRRSKFDVRDPDLRDLQDFLGRTKGKLYRYKDPSAPGQRRGLNFGPMAQDLQKSKIGRTVVVEGKDGLYVDTGRLALADHAALAELAREVAELRGKVAS